MALVKPAYLPPLYQDSAEAGRLILRDGSTAILRVARPNDYEAMVEFFRRLSPESRRQRFFSASKPPEEDIRDLCDSSDRHAAFTLVAWRATTGAPTIIAVGSYFSKDAHTAEVAFAVDDTLHGKGLGSLLLERLALLAAREGFSKFWAVTHPDNRPMIEVFRRSGFQLKETPAGGEVEVEFSLAPTAASASRAEWLDEVFTTASMRPFFYPRAIAVIGASRDPSSIGYRILETLVLTRFQGAVFPVNPKAAVIGSLRAYPRVADIPDPVDLAVIVVPRDIVLPIVDECAAHGVRALVVISAGFAETGAEGRLLQSQLVDKVRGYGMRLIGPNCLGLVNTDPAVRLNASFSPVYPPEGRVGLLSQSGALGIAILSLAQQLHLGLSTFVSVGNKADVSGNDLIQYWEHDPRTSVILLYLESFGNPRRFARIARRVSRGKPIIAVKGGRTKAGVRAAGSHTAALAASNVAVEALFQQTGVIRADTLEEMFDVAAALSNQPLPKGQRVGIVTNAGGPGILCADTCETGGLTIPELSESIRTQLAQFLPAAASLANPVDMIASASPEQYRRTIETLLRAEEIDALIILYIPVGVSNTAAIVEAIGQGVAQARAAGAAEKPVIVCAMTDAGGLPPLAVGAERIPAYQFPETAARVLSRMAEYARFRARPAGAFVEFEDLQLETIRAIIQRALAAGSPRWLSSQELSTLLAAAGIPFAGTVVRTADEAVDASEAIGFPVALKLASSTVVHKTEAGGVHLNLTDESGVRRAVAAIAAAIERAGSPEALEGFLVQPMIRGGCELMIGVVEDPSFGPLIAFGLGGVHVEILGDVIFRVAPLTDDDAREMVRGIKGYRLLEGYRGAPAADVPALEECLLRISSLVEHVPEIVELDLNPIFALGPGQGCRIVDARMRVAAAQGPS
ncbi:MAG: GNAT family N-acetyltransferase [Candidatus Omnitrophica bacterium]|nr:GNAT family N-acetyltransferase [Candidatus Omnitrophota bacterium]